MNIQVVSFSPTGTTAHTALLVAQQLAKALAHPGEQAPAVHTVPFTLPQDRVPRHFTAQDVVVAASPVYAGRLPNKLMPEFRAKLTGEGTPVLPVCTFGNRSSGDALRELVLLLEENGFRPVAAAAFAAEHVFSPAIGTARPDEADRAELADFAQAAAQRLRAGEWAFSVDHAPLEPYYTPLKADGTPARFLKAKPVRDAARCIDCGQCVSLCPMGSIDAASKETTGVCIKCQACIRGCPRQARALTDPEFLSHVTMLEQTYTRRAENQIWL